MFYASTRRLETVRTPLLLMPQQLFSRKRMLIVTLSAILFSLTTWAQAPYQFSFQGIARDAGGKVITNANVTVRNVGIENNAITPEFLMDIGGRINIRYDGETASVKPMRSQHLKRNWRKSES